MSVCSNNYVQSVCSVVVVTIIIVNHVEISPLHSSSVCSVPMIPLGLKETKDVEFINPFKVRNS